LGPVLRGLCVHVVKWTDVMLRSKVALVETQAGVSWVVAKAWEGTISWGSV
jgi:hypothetical protein